MLALAEFDIRIGNKLLWTSSDLPKTSVPGIEFQMIPSGLHDSVSDTIYFCNGSYRGVAAFSALQTHSSDRKYVRVYSLALLSETIPFKQETWLRGLLEKYILTGDTAVLETPTQQFSEPSMHPILAAPDFLQLAGPLVFELWKAALARYRVMIMGSGIPNISVRKLSQYAHLVGILGTIPSDLEQVLPSSPEPLEYRCLYNVTLVDTQKLRSLESYVASTTDSVLALADRDNCDLIFDGDGLRTVDGSPVKPTWTSRHKFTVNVNSLCPNYASPSHPVAYVFDRLFESTVQGLLWWASAGDTSLVSDPENFEDNSNVEGVTMVGLFHNYTRQLVNTFASLAQDYDNIVLVGIDDMVRMNLDPVSSSDRRFLERFALVWFDRVVHWKGMCCW